MQQALVWKDLEEKQVACEEEESSKEMEILNASFSMAGQMISEALVEQEQKLVAQLVAVVVVESVVVVVAEEMFDKWSSEALGTRQTIEVWTNNRTGTDLCKQGSWRVMNTSVVVVAAAVAVKETCVEPLLPVSEPGEPPFPSRAVRVRSGAVPSQSSDECALSLTRALSVAFPLQFSLFQPRAAAPGEHVPP